MPARARSNGESAGPLGDVGGAPRPPKALVPRPRLYAVLDSSVECPLTLVVGPAGTGKTILLSSWLAQSRAQISRTARWRNAHDSIGVAEALLLAAGMAADEARQVVRTSSGEPASAPRVIRALAALAEAGHRPDLVVVDDAHLLTSRETDLLARVLASRPDTVRLLIAARRDLPLPYYPLELRGLATMIRAGQLRFTPDESELLIREHWTDATAEAIDALRARADGWAAALVLGAHAMAGASDARNIRALLGRADEPVVDFLLGETFNSLSEQVQELLLCTYEEPVLTTARAVLLTGRPDADAQLSSLAASGLLVTAYSDEGTTLVYAYHPLLIELLRRRTMADGPEAEVARAAHHRAAMDHLSKREPEQALHHAVASGDESLITSLLLDDGPALIARGATDPIGDAYAALPDDTMDRFPQLRGVVGLYRRMVGDPNAAIVLAAQARESVQGLSTGSVADSMSHDALAADALILQLWQTHFGWQDQASTISIARHALGCRASPGHEHRPTLMLSPERQAWLMMELSAAQLWAGDLDEASVHADEGLVGARAAGHDGLLALGMGQRAVIELLNGNVRLAADTASQGLRHAERLDNDVGPFTDRSCLALAWSAYIGLDFATAADWLARMKANGASHSNTMVMATLRSILESALLAESGASQEALRLLVDPLGTASQLPPFLVRLLAMMRWYCAALVGDSRWAQAQIDDLHQAGFLVEADLLTAIEQAQEGRVDGAMERLEAALAVPGRTDPTTLACAAAVRAAVLLLRDDRDAARVALGDALTRSAPQELLYPLTLGLLAGADYVSLLSDEAQRDGAPAFASTALAAITAYADGRPVRQSERPVDAISPNGRSAETASLKDPDSHRRGGDVVVNGVPITLTEREVDVLEQLALGSSYHEIGVALYITENTVKTHLASLYRKLGVERRSAALRIARELELI